MKAFAIAAIITSLAVPALAQGDPAKAEANKAEEQKKKESEQIERERTRKCSRGRLANNLSRKQTRGEIYASFPSRTREGPDRHLSRQDLALNLSAKRRLCNTVGERVIEGATRCCAVSRARSHAAATTNLARSNHSLVLCALFGQAKRSAQFNIFMICPRWPAGDPPTGAKFCP